MSMMRLTSLLSLALGLGLAAAADDSVKVTFKGSGWIQFGRVEHSTDTVNNQPDNNFNKNWIQSTGGQLTAVVNIGSHWDGAVGLGAIQTHNARGALFISNFYAPFWAPLVEARVGYTQGWNNNADKVQLALGQFVYNYNPDVKNLGLYLLRGQAYPGTVISGFEMKHVLPIASVFGGLARVQLHDFQNDFIFNSESESKPLFDFSLADIVSYNIAPGIQIGAGVNFYRWFAQNDAVTSPSKSCFEEGHFYHQIDDGDPQACYSLDTLQRFGSHTDTTVAQFTQADGRPDSALAFNTRYDSARVDTVLGSMRGVKLMARFRVDPKRWFGNPASLGKDDLVLYSEAAVLGLKDQGKYFDDIYKRIPVMVGFNLPAFKFLDKLSIEVEYYPDKNYSDYGKAESYGSWVPRGLPNDVSYQAHAPMTFGGSTYSNVQVATPVDFSTDDWKWSLYGTRTIMGHLRLAAQVANDHYRNNGVGAGSYPTWAEALTTPKDWYWMCKLAYFF